MYPLNEMVIFADEDLIQQVLINLVQNAIEAVEDIPEPEINISCNENNDFQIIKISNNGPVVGPLMLEKIFIPFYTTKPGGSGIGLSFSRQVMFLHKGYLQVNSKPGETTFSLIFKK